MEENKLETDPKEELPTQEEVQAAREFTKDGKVVLAGSILLSSLMISLAWGYTSTIKAKRLPQRNTIEQVSSNQEFQEVKLPVKWNNLGDKMVKDGVINKNGLLAIYKNRGGLSDTDKKMLEDGFDGNFSINTNNSGYILNLLWALGLGNNNRILTQGPMSDPRYGGAGNFASTGGWTLAEGNAMEHFSKHSYITLTPEQQALVEEVSKNIYRPCCDNSTYFPDCNHGMAMLGLLELMASQGVPKDQMYRTALQVNAFWFPDTYTNLSKYFQSKGIDPRTVDPKEVLGREYSSASGYRRIIQEIVPQSSGSGSGGCGI